MRKIVQQAIKQVLNLFAIFSIVKKCTHFLFVYLAVSYIIFLVEAVLYGKEKFYGCEKPALIRKIKKFFFNKACMCGFFLNSNTIKAKQTIMDSNFNRIVFLLELHIENKGNL